MRRKISPRLMGWLLTASLSSLSLSAQDVRLRSNANVVLVPTLVTEPSGRPIFNLGADDFMVLDNGREQSVQLDEQLSLAQVSLVVAIDRGQGNAAALDKLRNLDTMLEPIIGGGKGEVAMVAFDSNVKLVHDFTSDTDTLNQTIKQLQAGDGGNAAVDAIRYSLRLLEARPKDYRKMLFLIGESRDHGSTTKLDDLIPQIERTNTLIYSAVFSPPVSSQLTSSDPPRPMNLLALFTLIREAARENILKTIAQLSGGEYLIFGTEKAFEDRLTEMASHVHNLYLLSFQPKKLIPGQHSLRVLVRGRDDALVYARNGYWAAAPAQ